MKKLQQEIIKNTAVNDEKITDVNYQKNYSCKWWKNPPVA